MSGSSTTLTTTRDAIATVLDTVTGLKVYATEPRDFDELPAAAIGLPSVRRTGADEREQELGRYDWVQEWPITLAVRMDDPSTGQTDALQLLAQVIGAFDDDSTLGNTSGVQDAKVVEAEPAFTEADTNRQMVLYTLQLDVLQLVT